jgi:hypothetical protein
MQHGSLVQSSSNIPPPPLPLPSLLLPPPLQTDPKHIGAEVSRGWFEANEE